MTYFLGHDLDMKISYDVAFHTIETMVIMIWTSLVTQISHDIEMAYFLTLTIHVSVSTVYLNGIGCCS